MSVIRINKSKSYTVMSNYHLREKKMSLKAKGLLSIMFSLPDDWNYSIAGLVSICKESATAIKSTLEELKKFGYLKIRKLVPDHSKGRKRIEYVYDIYEAPQISTSCTKSYKENGEKVVKNSNPQEGGFLPLDNQPLENLALDNRTQLNTKELNKEKQITKKENIANAIQKKVRWGEYKNVLLTEKEFRKLENEYGDEVFDIIGHLDSYIEMKGYKAKSHYLAIKKWGVLAYREHKEREMRLNRGFGGGFYAMQRPQRELCTDYPE